MLLSNYFILLNLHLKPFLAVVSIIISFDNQAAVLRGGHSPFPITTVPFAHPVPWILCCFRQVSRLLGLPLPVARSRAGCAPSSTGCTKRMRRDGLHSTLFEYETTLTATMRGGGFVIWMSRQCGVLGLGSEKNAIFTPQRGPPNAGHSVHGDSRAARPSCKI